ncbi:Imm10 family immunity protein [Thalassobacillus hwangdonensis]|uniref:Imm10 family immunity protein n=1 Tax=Thalassobacillus hwangdonensis TaxID=546108 RepID=A0ABW3L593_9BACI
MRGTWGMQKLLKANFLNTDVDEHTNVLIIGFADDEFNANEYVLLQKSLVTDDKRLESNEVNITYNDEIRSTFGGILNVVLYKDCVEIELDNNASRQLQTEKTIQISFAEKDDNLLKLKTHLMTMFQDHEGVFKSEV